MRQVLITGGAGFIGRYLAYQFAEDGWDVTVLDDLSCPNSRFDCVPLQHPRIACVRGSVLDGPLVESLVGEQDVVVHFASVVGVEETISRPLETTRNIQGTIHVVESLRPHQVALFGSSADVYGLHSVMHQGPMKEDDLVVFESATVNRWVYPKVKALEENLFLQAPCRAVNIRIFNCYGAEMDYPIAKRVVPQFAGRILDKQPLFISGDGQQVRSFCYYEDMLRGIRLALDHALAQEPAYKGTFNIGHDAPTSILELAHQMIEAALEVGLLSEPLPVRMKAEESLYSQTFNDTWDRVPDISRARKVLGFEPTVGLSEGLLRMMNKYVPIHLKRAAYLVA